ncbi:MAG: PAS domain S-box protein [Desulfotignum sp.]|jgi:PAS domain S-box-containing protein|nr:PAS domain S-box protein [Desulfotignum sp.]
MPGKKQDLFRLAFETSPDAINLNRLDDGLYLHINDGFAKMTGYTRADVLGKTSLELGIWKHPEDRQQLRHALEKTGFVQNSEFTFVGKNGKTLIGLMSARVLEINHEKIILSITKDITHRKLLEKALREKEAHYRLLFDSNRDAILLADTHRNIINCNRSFTQLFGYTLDEIKGRKTAHLYHDQTQYRQMGKELKNVTSHPDFVNTIQYQKKTGAVFPGETSVCFLQDHKQKTIGFIGIIKDVSARQKAEKALQKAGDALAEKASELQELNAALNVLLQKREQDIQKFKESIDANYASVVQPVLMQLKNTLSTADQQMLFDVLEKSIQDLVHPFSKTLSDPLHCLTHREIQVSAFIKQGLSNKEIAKIFNCGIRTIDTHRDKIREKLGLKHTRVNLKAYLSDL